MKGGCRIEGHGQRHEARVGWQKRKHAIVGSDEAVICCFCRDRPTLRADGRIDNGEVNRSGREAMPGATQEILRAADVTRRNVVADVNDCCSGNARQEHRLHFREGEKQMPAAAEFFKIFIR